MILPPPGFAQPIPDPSWDQLTEQDFLDLVGTVPGVHAVFFVRAVHDEEPTEDREP